MRGKKNYTIVLEESEIPLLINLFAERNFEELDAPAYTLYRARNENVLVTIYEKGPKLLVQGKGASDFIEFIFEPSIRGGESIFKDVLQDLSPHFGVDESGKGDFLGPLVISCLYSEEQGAKDLLDFGIQDSKKISSKKKISELAQKIKDHPSLRYETILIAPSRYNELYESFENLNSLLAWGHSEAIYQLSKKVPECQSVLIDQFASASLLESAVKKKSPHFQIEMRHRAEEDIVVAGASILARDAFLKWMRKKTLETGIDFFLGASSQVEESAKKLVKKYGEDAITDYMKAHFKTLKKIL